MFSQYQSSLPHLLISQRRLKSLKYWHSPLAETFSMLESYFCSILDSRALEFPTGSRILVTPSWKICSTTRTVQNTRFYYCNPGLSIRKFSTWNMTWKCQIGVLERLTTDKVWCLEKPINTIISVDVQWVQRGVATTTQHRTPRGYWSFHLYVTFAGHGAKVIRIASQAFNFITFTILLISFRFAIN